MTTLEQIRIYLTEIIGPEAMRLEEDETFDSDLALDDDSFAEVVADLADLFDVLIDDAGVKIGITIGQLVILIDRLQKAQSPSKSSSL